MGKKIEHVDDLSEERIRRAVGEVRIHLRQAVIEIHRGIQKDLGRAHDPSTLTKKRSRKKRKRRKKKTKAPTMAKLFNPAIQAVLIKHNFSPIALSLLLFLHETFKLTYHRGRKRTDRGKFFSAHPGNWERWIKQKLQTRSQLIEALNSCDEWEISEISPDRQKKILRSLEGHKFWNQEQGSVYPEGPGTSIRAISGGLPGLGKNS